MKWQTMIAIVGRGQADKVMAAAREAGAPGGTICSARGTASSSLLATLGLGDTRKDVLISVINRGDPDAILSAVQTVKAKGVVMMTDALIEDSEEDGMDYSWVLIEVICEEGYSEDIMVAARKAGAKGGTVINAHGTSTEDDVKFFGYPLVPEKEILMIVMDRDKADDVIDAISSLEILKKKGIGIIFSIPVKSFMNLG